jgi:hypothetical protein
MSIGSSDGTKDLSVFGRRLPGREPATSKTRRRPSLTRFVRPLLLLMLLALGAPASAHATWSAPIALSSKGSIYFDQQVAVNQNGDAVFAWSRKDGTTDCGGSSCFRVQARARSAGGVLSAAQFLSASGQDAHVFDVAIDQNGNAVFVWYRYDGTTDCGGYPGCLRVQARARSASGVLSAVQTLSAAGQNASGGRVGVDQSGNAVFVWGSGFPSTFFARTRSAAGVWGPTETIQPGGLTGFAVDAAGNAILAWRAGDATTDCNGHACIRAYTRVRSATGALSAVQTLSAGGREVWDGPLVGVDQNGNAVFVWDRYDGDTTNCPGFPNKGCRRVEARARTAAGTLSTIQTLSAAGQDTWDESPRVAVSPAGNAVFAWRRYSSGAIKTRARSATGTLSAIQTVATGGGETEVGIDQGGNAVYVFIAGSPYGLYSRIRSAAGVLGPTETVYAGGVDDPQLAVNPGGDAVAIWSLIGSNCGQGYACQILGAVGP